jgi:hypothetical protein
MPVYATSFEPYLQVLSARLWRLKRGYRFLEQHAEDDVPAAVLKNLGVLENTISRDFEALGLSPRSAAELGINLQRLARESEDEGPDFDWNSLSRTERSTLERLLAKGGPMASQDEIRAAERTRLEALVDAHGTEAEKASLLFSGIRRSGITLSRLAEAHEIGESIGRLSPDPELLAKLTRRAERRARLKLPQAGCAADPPTPYCDCVERALDEPGDGARRAVLKLAAAFHRKPEPIPALPHSPRSRRKANPDLTEPDSAPPPAEPDNPRAEPTVRVVKHFPRWYDGAEHPRFSDMTF